MYLKNLIKYNLGFKSDSKASLRAVIQDCSN